MESTAADQKRFEMFKNGLLDKDKTILALQKSMVNSDLEKSLQDKDNELLVFKKERVSLKMRYLNLNQLRFSMKMRRQNLTLFFLVLKLTP